MDITKAVTHLSLCSGYGGIGLGLRKIMPSVREIAHVEIESFAVANLVQKMESGLLDQAPIYTDVKTFPYKDFYGTVDILSAGFPCTPFSQAGTRKGVKDERHLYPYISEAIKQCRPTITLFENVEGIISSKTTTGQSVLQYVLSDLERMGYRATAGIFSASEVGAPHQRKRVFIMGYSAGSRRSQDRYKKAVRKIGAGKQRRLQKFKGRRNKLSDTTDSRCRGWAYRNYNSRRKLQEQTPQKQSALRSETTGRCGNFSHYPARPNEHQYTWEEPRVEPKLGRTANGLTSRVDRLRMLGNGVVPDTVSKAFIVLLNRLIKE